MSKDLEKEIHDATLRHDNSLVLFERAKRIEQTDRVALATLVKQRDKNEQT